MLIKEISIVVSDDNIKESAAQIIAALAVYPPGSTISIECASLSPEAEAKLELLVEQGCAVLGLFWNLDVFSFSGTGRDEESEGEPDTVNLEAPATVEFDLTEPGDLFAAHMNKLNEQIAIRAKTITAVINYLAAAYPDMLYDDLSLSEFLCPYVEEAMKEAAATTSKFLK